MTPSKIYAACGSCVLRDHERAYADARRIRSEIEQGRFGNTLTVGALSSLMSDNPASAWAHVSQLDHKDLAVATEAATVLLLLLEKRALGEDKG